MYFIEPPAKTLREHRTRPIQECSITKQNNHNMQ